MKRLTFAPKKLLYTGGEIQSLQALKFLCAIMVFFIHIHTRGHYDYEIYLRGAVPAFYMISGYFLLSEDGTLSISRIRRTLRKIVVIAVCANLAYVVFESIRNFNDIEWFRKMFLDPEMLLRHILLGDMFCAALWFLNGYGISLLLIMLAVRLKVERLLYLWIIPGLILNFIMDNFHMLWSWVRPFDNMFSSNALSCSLPCMVLGMLLRRHERILRGRRHMIGFLSVLAVVLLGMTFIEYRLECRMRLYGTEFFFSEVAFGMVLICLALVCREERWLRVIAGLGRNLSMYIYLSHILVYYLCALVFFGEVKEYGYENTGFAFIVLAATLLLSLGLHLTARAIKRRKHSDSKG
ncbi:MAG: acyltransferase [Muribaculaceae bacterium]|nr:acyltransferase [Muribaculaceae bacterium]